jgi:hypothetical protein
MLFPLVPYRLKSLTNRLYDLFQQGLLRAELVIVQRNINFLPAAAENRASLRAKSSRPGKHSGSD